MAGPGEDTFRRGGNRSTVGSVEVTRLDDGSVALRDLKNQAAPGVVFSGQEWAEFVHGVKSNRFDAGQGAAPNAGPRPGVDAESTVRIKL